MNKTSLYAPWVCHVSRTEDGTVLGVEALEPDFTWEDHPEGLRDADLQIVKVKVPKAPIEMTNEEALAANELTTSNGIMYELINKTDAK